MNNFFGLQESTVTSDRLRFTIVTEILTKIFGVGKIERDTTYKYDTKLETQDNHQLILDNWDMLFFGEKQPERCKTNRRLVYWTIKCVVDLFNQKYHPQKLVTFERVTRSQRNSDGSRGTVTHYDLCLG